MVYGFLVDESCGEWASERSGEPAMAGTTDYAFGIDDNTAIQLAAPGSHNGRPFLRWEDGTGAVLTGQQTLNVLVNADVTYVAVHHEIDLCGGVFFAVRNPTRRAPIRCGERRKHRGNMLHPPHRNGSVSVSRVSEGGAGRPMSQAFRAFSFCASVRRLRHIAIAATCVVHSQRYTCSADGRSAWWVLTERSR